MTTTHKERTDGASGERDRSRTPGRAREPDVESGGVPDLQGDEPVVDDHPIVRLQREAGNRATQRLVRSGKGIQPKLRVGRPNDRYEREADRVARAVTRPSSRSAGGGSSVGEEASVDGETTGTPPRIQRLCTRCRGRLSRGQPLDCPDCERRIQRAPNEAKSTGDPLPPAIDRSLLAGGGRGRPLPASIRSFFEPRFGADFGDVRIHADHRAAELNDALNARAFTHGRDIYFGAGRFDPETTSGRSLLAHELTHVVQQNCQSLPATPRSIHHADTSESDAERGGRQVSSATGSVAVTGSTPPSIQRQTLSREEIHAELQRIDELLFGGSPSPEEIEMLQAQRDLLLTELQRLTGSPPAETTTPSIAETTAPSAATPTQSAVPEGARTTLDPGELTGEQLRAEIESLREWRLAQPAGTTSPEVAMADENLHRLEAELSARQSLGIETQRIVNEVARLQREGTLPAPTDILEVTDGSASGVGLAGGAFTASFLSAAVEQIPSNDYERLGLEILANPQSFIDGVEFGAVVGAGKQLWDNLMGLIELAQLAHNLKPLNLAQRVAVEGARLLFDPEHVERRRQQLEEARQIAIGLEELLRAIFDDPAFFTVHGAELGRIAGTEAGSWFHGDFMRRSTFMKGQTVGEIAGRVILEIALMFLGPEEWIARGIVGAGQIARYSSQLTRAVLEFMERIPGLSRLLRRGAGAADEFAGGARAAEGTAETAGEVGGVTRRSSPETSDAPATHGSPPAERLSAEAPSSPGAVTEGVTDPSTRPTLQPAHPSPDVPPLERATEELRRHIDSAGPSTVEGYSVEVPVGEGRVWRRSHDGRWCLFSSPAECPTDDEYHQRMNEQFGELTGPQRLHIAPGNLESVEIARQAGVPELVYGDATVLTRLDFEDVVPEGSLPFGRPAPAPLPTQGRTVSRSDRQNTEWRADLRLTQDALAGSGARIVDVRVDQTQVSSAGGRAGRNRPDLQFAIVHAKLNGRHIHIEYDRPPGTRAMGHAERILMNDPDAIVVLKIIE